MRIRLGIVLIPELRAVKVGGLVEAIEQALARIARLAGLPIRLPIHDHVSVMAIGMVSADTDAGIDLLLEFGHVSCLSLLDDGAEYSEGGTTAMAPAEKGQRLEQPLCDLIEATNFAPDRRRFAIT